MATVQIPQEMLPRMDWHAEDKAAAWEFFTRQMKLYCTVAHTVDEAKVDTILFFAGQEASDRWETLKEQMSAEDQVKSEEVFKVFDNSFKKSSSHWQARDKYLSDIKQGKQQTTAELDVYIKEMVRKCQFKQHEQQACKIDILYHATAHFEVRKFVHNAKLGELSYDKMIEVAKAHERTCHEYQQHKQAHSGTVSNYQNHLLKTNALVKSFQRKKPCGKCGRNHNHGDCPAHRQTCHSCGRKNHWTQMCRIRRNSSQLAAHPPHTDNRTKKAIQQQAAEARRRRRWQDWEEVLQERRHSLESE